MKKRKLLEARVMFQVVHEYVSGDPKTQAKGGDGAGAGNYNKAAVSPEIAA